jgi:glutathionyl-hydroquinone reductase
MQDLKGDVCSHNETEEIIDAINKAFDAFASGNREYLANDVAPSKYEASFNAERLYNEMKTLAHV